MGTGKRQDQGDAASTRNMLKVSGDTIEGSVRQNRPSGSQATLVAVLRLKAIRD